MGVSYYRYLLKKLDKKHSKILTWLSVFIGHKNSFPRENRETEKII